MYNAESFRAASARSIIIYPDLMVQVNVGIERRHEWIQLLKPCWLLSSAGVPFITLPHDKTLSACHFSCYQQSYNASWGDRLLNTWVPNVRPRLIQRSPHADLLFAAIIRCPKAKGQRSGQTKVLPPQRNLMWWQFYYSITVWGAYRVCRWKFNLGWMGEIRYEDK